MYKESLWKRIDTITKRLYDCYMLLSTKENNEEEYNKYIKIVDLILEFESKLYSQLSLEEIEKLILTIYPSTGEIIYNLHSANFAFIKDKCMPNCIVNIIEQRKYNRLKIEYNKRKNFNEDYITDAPEEERVDFITGTYDIGNKKIYVFDRINQFEGIKSLAQATINIDYIHELEKLKDNKSAKKIKYNLLFLDIYTSNMYLKNQKENIKNRPSKELYNYFVNYFREKYFYDTLNFFKIFNDEWFKDESESIDFDLSLVELKTYMDFLDDNMVNEEYENLLRIELPNQSVEYLKQYMNIQMRKKVNKKEKIKK